MIFILTDLDNNCCSEERERVVHITKYMENVCKSIQYFNIIFSSYTNIMLFTICNVSMIYFYEFE